MGTHPLNWKDVVRGERWIHSPHMLVWQRRVLAEMRLRSPQQKNGFWILSSGTQSVNEVKAIALEVDAILASAESVNRHLQVKAKDRWIMNLPWYHVGGLGILARSYLSGAHVSRQLKWDPSEFVKLIIRDRSTLCSLVPTQIHDLVVGEWKCPQTMRAIVVGGGALSPSLYQSARQLGWPLLPSYGLTETASQVATADLKSLSSQNYPKMKILSHARIELREQRVFVRAQSLCRWIARGGRDGWFTLEDPLRDGWLPTEDLAEWTQGGLSLLGRRDDVVKVLGVLVAVNQLEHEAQDFFMKAGLRGDLTILALPGGREGHRLVLVTNSSQSLLEWERQLQIFNSRIDGPRRIKQFCWVPSIPRGELGKVKRASLAESLGGAANKR